MFQLPPFHVSEFGFPPFGKPFFKGGEGLPRSGCPLEDHPLWELAAYTPGPSLVCWDDYGRTLIQKSNPAGDRCDLYIGALTASEGVISGTVAYISSGTAFTLPFCKMIDEDNVIGARVIADGVIELVQRLDATWTTVWTSGTGAASVGDLFELIFRGSEVMVYINSQPVFVYDLPTGLQGNGYAGYQQHRFDDADAALVHDYHLSLEQRPIEWFIDPSAQFNGDGRLPTPASADGEPGAYNTCVNQIFTEPNTKIYFKRGTTDNFFERFPRTAHQRILLQADDIEILSYGDTGDKPIIFNYFETQESDWVDEGSNIWSYSGPESYSNQIHIIGLGALNSSPIRVPYFTESVPINAHGLYDSRGYSSGNNPNQVFLYAESNPVTFYGGPIYVAHEQNTIRIDGNNISIHDLEVRYAFDGISVRAETSSSEVSNFSIHDCVFDRCYKGVRLYGRAQPNIITDSSIYKNVFYNMLNSAINFNNYTFRLNIYENKIYGCCLSESTAAIYEAGNTSHASFDDANVIHHNYVENAVYGNYWPVDGAAYYSDMQSKYTVWSYNFAVNCTVGMILHTGDAMNILYNVFEDCGNAIRVIGMPVIDPEYHVVFIVNNTFVNCASSIDPDNLHNCVLYLETKENGDCRIQNNIFDTKDTAERSMYYMHYAQHENTVIENYNIFKDNGVPPIWGLSPDEEIPVDSTDLIANPLLDGYHIPTTSPAYEAGIWIPDVHAGAVDIDGDPVDEPVSIGCDEGEEVGAVFYNGQKITYATEVVTYSDAVLTVITSERGTISGQGIDCGSDCETTLPLYGGIKLTASANSGYYFHSWIGEGLYTGDNPLLLVLPGEDYTIRPVFGELVDTETPCMTSPTTPLGIASTNVHYDDGTYNLEGWKGMSCTAIDAYDCWCTPTPTDAADLPVWLDWREASATPMTPTRFRIRPRAGMGVSWYPMNNPKEISLSVIHSDGSETEVFRIVNENWDDASFREWTVDTTESGVGIRLYIHSTQGYDDGGDFHTCVGDFHVWGTYPGAPEHPTEDDQIGPWEDVPIGEHEDAPIGGTKK